MTLIEELQAADIGDLLPGITLIVDSDGNISDANVAGWSLLGCGRGQPGISLTDVIAEPAERVERFLAMCRRNRSAVPSRFTIKSDDGGETEFMARGAAIRSGNPGDVLLFLEEKSSATNVQKLVVLNETIDQLRLEVKLRRNIESILEAEKQTLAAVFKGESLIDALGILANAIEANSDGMLVSILLLEDDRYLRHAVAPSLPSDYVTAIDGLEIGPDVGSCGTAAFTSRPVISSDVLQDTRWTDFLDLAMAADLRACWSCPIIASNGSVLGTLAMYFRSPREPSENELQLIENSAYVASVAIERYRSQQMLTGMLAREQRDREEAEAQNRAKDEFLAMLGHELRNPLGAIMNAALAIESAGNETQPDDSLLKIILNESRLLKRILDDLLDISRLSRGKLKLQKSTFSIGEFVEELVTAVNVTYRDRQVDIVMDDDPGLMCADRARLRQSVQNLIDNAMKYSEAGDSIEIRIFGAEDAVSIVVTDSGHGIDASLLEAIFEPFTQSEMTIDRSNSGLGLGLALVKRFAEMHGGDVTVSSEGEGRGSCFTLTMPRGDVDPDALQSIPAPAIPADSMKRILVVEDNKNARDGLCQLLDMWGYEVLEAGDGREALDIIRSDCPDVALVDIGLPVVDGYEVARSVRQDADLQALTLVALTGYGQASDRERALEAGFDMHIVKPADVDSLIKVFGAPAA